jgi:ABC-type nickel/cobalt efflux system permease component RcnA
MKNINKIFAILLSFSIPALVFAATNGLIPCEGTAADPCTFGKLADLVNNILNWFIGISISVAAITFSIAGAQMLMNPDNPGKREEAMEMFKKTVIGMLIVLGAWLIVHTIVSTLASNSSSALRFLKS